MIAEDVINVPLQGGTGTPFDVVSKGGSNEEKNLGMRILTAGLASLMMTGTAFAGTLTLYTSQPDADAARTVEEFKKLNPDIDVQVYRSGTSDIMSKLAAEFSAGAPQADVLLIADAVSMESLKADKRLLQFSRRASTDLKPVHLILTDITLAAS